MTIPKFQKTILDWYKEHKRNLPWRNTKNPYRIMVSEIMLQQTQVSRVLPKYKEFLQAFPDSKALATCKDSDLLAIWSGLGYWRRARFLKEACKKIEQDFNGKFPKDVKTLLTLPGIGPYTAGAISCFAFGNTDAFIDTNIRRVYLHFFFQDQTDVHDSEILKIAKKAIPKEDARNWHWALFDYGALVLKDKKINKKSRHYNKQSKFKGSFRSYRAKLMRNLLTQPDKSMPKTAALDFLEDELREDEQDYSPQEIIKSLIADNLIKQNNTRIFL
ncbi:MAG TPA: A/G-specific adenine glycosylase [Candidatus Andersenbacteria bacterium]|nr:A/G-specific adenine glycosylase [Candidatus Andersenbacteria bacterium]